MKFPGLPHRLSSSLRWRLTAAISGVVLLCAAVCVTGAVIFLRQALTDRATEDLRQTLQGVQNFLGPTSQVPASGNNHSSDLLGNNQSTDLLGLAELIAADPLIGSDVQDKNQQSLLLHLTLYFADLNADVMDVVDARGKVLVRMEDTQSYGDNIGARISVHQALTGHEWTAYETDLPQHENASGYALRATVPLRIGSDVIGAVVVGRTLNGNFASRIGKALNANVNLIAGNRRTGTTLTDSHGLPVTGLPEPPDVLDRIQTGKASIACTCEQGEAALSGLVPLLGADGKPVGAVEIISPLGPVYSVITQLSLLLLALGAGVVVLGTVLALGIGRRLTIQLHALEGAAAEVASLAGSDARFGTLQEAVVMPGNDEVASLARSFSAMMAALDERLALNARLYAAAQARVHELSGLAEIARMLNGAATLQETLDRLGERVCRLVGCSGVAILLIGEDRRPIVHGGHGLPKNFAANMERALLNNDPEGRQLATRQAMQTGEIVWHRTDTLPEAFAALRESAVALDWNGALALPLRLQDRITGVLTCFTSATEPLPESNMSLLMTIADQVAVAVENARLEASARTLAAIEERSRLARELHDSVTQALFSMTLHVRAAQITLQRSGNDPQGTLMRSLQQLNELTHGALAEMRALIFELRPNALVEEGLVAALSKQAAALSARESLAIEVIAPTHRIRMDVGVEEHLYRLVLEALHNVVKHAGASRVEIRLSTLEDGAPLQLEIIDDGCGFDPRADRPGHLGLETMRERVRHIGGLFAIESSPGKGTTVRVHVPNPGGNATQNREEASVAS